MEIWQVVLIPTLTVALSFLARPFENILLRKRTSTVNSIRVLSEFFYRNRIQLTEAGAIEIVLEFDQWLQHPNALGSETRVAQLVGHMSSLIHVSAEDLSVVDIALNALDQKATERERRSAAS